MNGPRSEDAIREWHRIRWENGPIFWITVRKRRG